jgi:hypothetical protein
MNLGDFKMSHLKHIYLRLAAVALVACFSASGCKKEKEPEEPEYDWLSITRMTDPPVQVQLASLPIVIMEGIGVIVHTRPMSSTSTHFERSASVVVKSMDNDVLRIIEGEQSRQFLFIGVSPGNAEIEVRVGGRSVDTLPVTVEEWSGEE